MTNRTSWIRKLFSDATFPNQSTEDAITCYKIQIVENIFIFGWAGAGFLQLLGNITESAGIRRVGCQRGRWAACRPGPRPTPSRHRPAAKKSKLPTGFDHRPPCPSRQSSSLAHPVWSHHTSLQSLPTPSNPSFNSETCFCQEKIHKCHLQSVVHFICHLIRCQLYIERGLKKSFLNNGEERGLACV